MYLSVDYSLMLSIVDDSLLVNSREKLKCLLFAPDIRSLPDANVGDIVRFHRLKVNASDCHSFSSRHDFCCDDRKLIVIIQ